MFHIPSTYPNESLPVYNSTSSSHVVIEEMFSDDDSESNINDIPESSAQGSMTPKTKKGKRPILSEIDVCRSLRIKKMHQGFKVSSCKDKSCLGCSATPPTVSPSIIKDLGATFCNIKSEELTDEKLHEKPANAKPVGKQASKKKSDQ